MAKLRKSYRGEDVKWSLKALEHAREARYILSVIGAKRAAARLRPAIKSIEGAVRHAERVQAHHGREVG